MKVFFSFALILGLSSSVLAETKKSVKTAKKATEVTLTVDPVASQIKWTGKKKIVAVGSVHTGTVAVKEGQLIADEKGLKSGTIVVDLTKITNEDVKDADYNKKLVSHLQGEDFFFTQKYPTAEFKLKKFTEVVNVAPGAPNAKAEGTLKIRGIEKPVTLSFFYTPQEGAVAIKGTTEIDRTQFGIKYNDESKFSIANLKDKVIENKFTLEFDVAAKKI